METKQKGQDGRVGAVVQCPVYISLCYLSKALSSLGAIGRMKHAYSCNVKCRTLAHLEIIHFKPSYEVLIAHKAQRESVNETWNVLQFGLVG